MSVQNDDHPVELRFRANPTSLHTSRRTTHRRVNAGTLVRVRAGAYAVPEELAAANARRGELARIEAVVGTRRSRVVLSHEAAAVVWGIPRIGPAPDAVELVDARSTRPRSMNGVRWRRTPFDAAEVVERNGFLVTGLLQTLTDLVCDRDFVNAVVALDASTGAFLRSGAFVVARGVPIERVTQRLREFGRRTGARAALRAIEFADHRAESPGESLSRAQMHLLGYPPPELQVVFDRADGGIDRVDFDWPEFGAFGEFDGDLKYLDPRYRGGRTLEQVILDEKKRDQRIGTRHRRRSAHWDWKVAMRPRSLAGVLDDLGLHRRARP
ncbi:hypothetical protein LQ757_01160 [Agromyces sp. SYSU K20354]|uniref:hypothetical protein n=1 Tax=Agromyces cavernae TaxID=2898659 RepID=UPI001E344DF4|nr:hypothetical protein [Agromyces cavernae]MCD2440873.1 hypothetical protein [Agromyces cavernae]